MQVERPDLSLPEVRLAYLEAQVEILRQHGIYDTVARRPAMLFEPSLPGGLGALDPRFARLLAGYIQIRRDAHAHL